MFPFSCLTMMLPISLADLNSALVRTVLLKSLIKTSPAAIDIFSNRTASSISRKLILLLSIKCRSASIKTSLFNNPVISTLEISPNVSISSWRYSAYTLSSSKLKSPDRLILRIGNSEKSISITIGSKSKSPFALSTPSFTSCKAVFSSISVLNSTIIEELSCKEEEVSFLIPLIDFNSFSIGLVIKFSISAGEFPGYTVWTIIVGMTISGYKDLGMDL